MWDLKLTRLLAFHREIPIPKSGRAEMTAEGISAAQNLAGNRMPVMGTLYALHRTCYKEIHTKNVLRMTASISLS